MVMVPLERRRVSTLLFDPRRRERTLADGARWRSLTARAQARGLRETGLSAPIRPLRTESV
jgi:hypothetical protein